MQKVAFKFNTIFIHFHEMLKATNVLKSFFVALGPRKKIVLRTELAGSNKMLTLHGLSVRI